MTKYEIGRQIGNRKVITTSGEPVGQLYDLEMETNGKLNSLVILPDVNTKATFPKDDKGRFVIPYSMVNAIGQYIVIKA
ncbi:MAG: hypothetical protein CVT88_02095 [Candidatus Altiarchaeales archaeon HGW-Altiarchaeales-1]|nr:MAG: hypothetical protein CVT88_02095 [Candidatus Altiarchaeales archaeon HGW-Altiarchaeales-1]